MLAVNMFSSMVMALTASETAQAATKPSTFLSVTVSQDLISTRKSDAVEPHYNSLDAVRGLSVEVDPTDEQEALA